MFCLAKFIFFLLVTISFGFISLSQITNISSLLILIPTSISFGIAAYVFICHVLSFIIGPQQASIITLFILISISFVILIFKKKSLTKIEKEINNVQLIILSSIALIICFLTSMAASKFGTFDRESHIPIAMTMFHNNVYPPKDCFRPDYILLYHYGGDLLAGAVYYITNFDISKAYESMATILSGTTFFSFFALAWILTKNFKLSLIGGFCTYFGGGLLWLDAVLRFLTKNLPEDASNWTFFQTFLNIGIHGGINNAPSILALISTFNLGNPLLVFSLILFWKMTEEKSFKSYIFYIIFLNIALFTLSLTADWLYVTFWAAVLFFLLILWINKKKQLFIPIFILLITSIFLNKSIGNALFLQGPIQRLGRTNIFDVGIKENLFSVVSWGRLSSHVMNYQTISCFSWDFICELGLTLFLFPIVLIYLIKTKNSFAYLLFLTALTTMPIPIVIDFKLNPVELVRLFAFGNVMLILFITCGIAFLYKPFLQKNILIIVYIIVFTLSPLSQLISGATFSPYVFSNKSLVQTIIEDSKKLKSINDRLLYFRGLNESILGFKNRIFNSYKNEIDFLKHNSKPKDVAISSIPELPSYAGVYCYIPSKKYVYWDQLYSSHNAIYETLFKTFDPHLLHELNIKWILISNDFKEGLPTEAKEILHSNSLLKLVYVNGLKNQEPNKQFEIYHIEDIEKPLTSYKQQTAWLLVSKEGQTIETFFLNKREISLFKTSKDALLHLKKLLDGNPVLKNQLITAQPVVIKNMEKQIADNMLNIKIEKNF